MIIKKDFSETVYRFKDSVWEKKVRAEAEKIEEQHGIERQGDKDTHKGN